MNKYTSILIVVVLSLLIISCQNETEVRDGNTLGQEYFPSSIDNTWIYQSDSILYNNQLSTIDTFTSFIKEVVVDSFSNVQGETVFKIERFIKRNLDDEWEILDVWVNTISIEEVRRTEENLTFVKLVFPLRDDSRWDGNVFIDDNTEVIVGGETLTPYRYWDYKVDGVDGQYSFNGLVYNDVVTISQAKDSSEIELRYAEEFYSKNIGLVYKKQRILESQCDNCAGQTWEEKAEKGYIHTMRLIEHF